VENPWMRYSLKKEVEIGGGVKVFIEPLGK
jgi:hypothetical protein